MGNSFLTRAVLGGDKRWEELIDRDGVTFRRSRTSLDCTRKFILRYDELDTFYRECFPEDSYLTAQHPNLPLFVDTLDMNPLLSEEIAEYNLQGLASNENFVCKVSYAPWESEDYNSPESPDDPSSTLNNFDLLVGNMNFRTEAMTLPGKVFKWEGSGKDVANNSINPVLMIQLMDFTVSIPQAKFVPLYAVRKNIGRVNSEEFFGAAPETVLYLGTGVRWRHSSDGSRTFDLEHRFSEKRIPSALVSELGNYMGYSSKYGTLPLTSARHGPVAEHDYAFLTAKDGNNPRGEYVYDGEDYVYANSADTVYGWNHYMNPETGEWDVLLSKDDDSKTYKDAPNMKALFA